MQGAPGPEIMGWHWLEMGGRLGLALVAAAVLGWERERMGRAAGLRTHMLVSLGSAAFTLTGLEWMNAARRANGDEFVDPTRVIQAVATGIGFLGAGSILQTEGRVKGLTTAAGIWVVAAIGVSAGAGQYVLALMVTLAAFVTLTFIKRVERRPGAVRTGGA